MMDAELREKVVQGLELCLKGLSDLCPYKDSDAPGGCRDELMYDVMMLLCAQVPRVLTLEEADKAPYVWLESKEGGLGIRRIRIVPIDSTAISIQTFGQPDTIGNIYEFEKRFRCWNAKPTDEQRKAAKWND